MLNSYFLKRCIQHISNKSFYSFLKNGINYLLYILNPNKMSEFPFSHFFKKKRILNKKFIKENLKEFDSVKFDNYFNYRLKTDLIPKNPIIYSFGIGGQIKFELEILRHFEEAKIYCYDPTSTEFIKNFKLSKNIKLIPYGIWVEDKKIPFFLNRPGGVGSATDYFGKLYNTIDHFQCYTLKTLMQMNNDKKVDILKIDIEGAAIEVINQILDVKIFPTQIAAEFEFTENDNLTNEEKIKYAFFKKKLINLINRMKKLNYSCYNNPRMIKPYAAIEIIFTKNS